VLRDLIACGRMPLTLLTVIKRQGEGSPIVEAAHAFCVVDAGDDSDVRARTTVKRASTVTSNSSVRCQLKSEQRDEFAAAFIRCSRATSRRCR
jgi:hypothetical protein